MSTDGRPKPRNARYTRYLVFASLSVTVALSYVVFRQIQSGAPVAYEQTENCAWTVKLEPARIKAVEQSASVRVECRLTADEARRFAPPTVTVDGPVAWSTPTALSRQLPAFTNGATAAEWLFTSKDVGDFDILVRLPNVSDHVEVSGPVQNVDRVVDVAAKQVRLPVHVVGPFGFSGGGLDVVRVVIYVFGPLLGLAFWVKLYQWWLKRKEARQAAPAVAKATDDGDDDDDDGDEAEGERAP